MNVSCSAKSNTCPLLLNAACAFYEGENLIYIGVNMNDNLQTALEKLNVAFSDTITSIYATSPLQITSGATPTISILQSSASSNGYLSSSDWSIFNNKQNAITLTTTGSSGVATFISDVLNIPNYTLSGLGGSLQAVTDIGSVTTNVITANGFTLPAQGIGLSTFKISQIMGENDYWNIYGYASVVDYGELVFELNDNAASVNGQRFRFYYNNSFSGTSKDILLMNYDGATIDGTLTVNKDALVNGITIGRGNTNGSQDTAIGYRSLFVATVSGASTAIGYASLTSQSTGYRNTALGASSGSNVTTGIQNTLIGVRAGINITTGSNNIHLGYAEGSIGLVTGSNNTIIGSNISGLNAALSNNIIIADGQGNIRFRDDATNTILSRLAGTGTRMVVAGTNGELSTQAFTTGTVTSIATSGPITGGPITSSGTIGITQSSALVDGYLSSTDWSIFNGKQVALNGTGFVKASGTTISYDNSTYVPTSRTLTINGTAYDLSANRSWTIASGIAIGGAITSATAGSVLFAGTSGVLQQDNANLFWDDTNNRLGIDTATPSHVLTVNTTSSSLPPVRISDFYYDYYIGYGAAVGTSKNNNYTHMYRISNETYWVSSQGGHNLLIGASQVGRFTLNGFIVGTFTDDTFNKLQITGSAIFYGSSFTNKFTTTGRLLLGTTTESTYIFDVVGNERITGNSTVIATTASVTAGMAGWWASNGYVTTTIPASTSFSGAGYGFSSLIGNNYMTYSGSATFAADTLTGSVLGINNIAFTAATSTITMTQGGSIRTYSGGLFQNTTSGTVNGTITDLSGIAVRPLYRASGSSTITVTNNYGLLINNQNEYSHATITNRWGVYQEGALDNNYFAGKTIIGPSNTVGGATSFKVTGLPTSSAGLSTGDVWNNGGVLTIV